MLKFGQAPSILNVFNCAAKFCLFCHGMGVNGTSTEQRPHFYKFQPKTSLLNLDYEIKCRNWFIYLQGKYISLFKLPTKIIILLKIAEFQMGVVKNMHPPPCSVVFWPAPSHFFLADFNKICIKLLRITSCIQWEGTLNNLKHHPFVTPV